MESTMIEPTEEEYQNLDRQFEKLQKYVKYIALGDIRSMIVTGPPGVGKSVTVKNTLTANGLPSDHQYLHGKITPLSLYHALYTHRQPKQVVVLDDTDSIFKDPEGQNILKAVMDTTEVRHVTWASTTSLLQRMSVPEEFEFAGSVVLITNVGFDGNLKMSVHLRAIKDRSFTVAVGADDKNGKFKMIAYMVMKRDMLAKYEFSSTEKLMLLKFVFDNLKTLSTLSLRTVIKIADLYRLDPDDWRAMAVTGLVEGT